MRALIRRHHPSDEYFFEEGCHIIELSNSDDDPQLSVARARVPVGQTTRIHRLKGTVERYLIITGKGDIEVDGEWLGEVTPGDLVLIPAGASQRVRCTSDIDLVFYALCTPRFDRADYQDMDGGRGPR